MYFSKYLSAEPGESRKEQGASGFLFGQILYILSLFFHGTKRALRE